MDVDIGGKTLLLEGMEGGGRKGVLEKVLNLLRKNIWGLKCLLITQRGFKSDCLGP